MLSQPFDFIHQRELFDLKIFTIPLSKPKYHMKTKVLRLMPKGTPVCFDCNHSEDCILIYIFMLILHIYIYINRWCA